jgi:hypothetical protein
LVIVGDEVWDGATVAVAVTVGGTDVKVKVEVGGNGVLVGGTGVWLAGTGVFVGVSVSVIVCDGCRVGVRNGV